MPTFDVSKLNQGCIKEATNAILKRNTLGKRLIVAVAGPPGVGKSTISGEIVAALNAIYPDCAALLPMDGFHLDNPVLSDAGLLDRKGSPPTFDFGGFQSLLQRMRDDKTDHYVPVFDRGRDLSVAGARKISTEISIVVVEGNYLLLDQAPWRALHEEFDYTIFINAALAELKNRLIQRWLENGYDQEGATVRAEVNDIPNAELVISHQLEADQRFDQGGQSRNRS